MIASAETVIMGRRTWKCCRFLKHLSCFCKCFSNSDDEDGSDKGHNIHCKCVLACCAGTVADNDFADKNNRGVYNTHADGFKNTTKSETETV